MAQSIKLGSDTYLDASGVIVKATDSRIRKELANAFLYDFSSTTLSDMRLSAIGDWLKVYALAVGGWCCGRFNAGAGATSGYFGTSALGFIASLSSVNYGWAILISDNANSVVFGQLASGTWTWRHPTMTTVS